MTSGLFVQIRVDLQATIRTPISLSVPRQPPPPPPPHPPPHHKSPDISSLRNVGPTAILRFSPGG